MARADSTTLAKPEKPYAGFPLTPHASGKWCKKIKGTIHYFGNWSDPEGALEEYHRAKLNLEKGRPKPPAAATGLTIKGLVDAFLTAKERRRDVGDISGRTFDGLRTTGKRIADFFGRQTPVESLQPTDFADYWAMVSKTRNAVSVGNEITRVKQFFIWAYKSDLLDRPVKFGPEFSRPSARTVRLHRAASGKPHVYP